MIEHFGGAAAVGDGGPGFDEPGMQLIKDWFDIALAARVTCWCRVAGCPAFNGIEQANAAQGLACDRTAIGRDDSRALVETVGAVRPQAGTLDIALATQLVGNATGTVTIQPLGLRGLNAGEAATGAAIPTGSSAGRAVGGARRRTQ